MANKQILWIDVAKCMAIIAVMVDHTNGLLYHSSNIAYASYYSVTLFILISGMMCFLSNLRHGFSWWEGVKHSTAKIFSAYLFAKSSAMGISKRRYMAYENRVFFCDDNRFYFYRAHIQQN